jgi:hypothetical protein
MSTDMAIIFHKGEKCHYNRFLFASSIVVPWLSRCGRWQSRYWHVGVCPRVTLVQRLMRDKETPRMHQVPFQTKSKMMASNMRVLHEYRHACKCNIIVLSTIGYSQVHDNQAGVIVGDKHCPPTCQRATWATNVGVRVKVWICVSTYTEYCVISPLFIVLTGGRHNNPSILAATRDCRWQNPYVLWIWVDVFVRTFCIQTRLSKVIFWVCHVFFCRRDTARHQPLTYRYPHING